MNMNLAAGLREKKRHLGTWLSVGSPVIAELAAESGFDWLLLDLEHGCGSEAALLSQLQAVRNSGVAAMVRVGAPHPDLVARVLDWGADGLMIPHVSTAAEAEACVRAAHYPPRGRRGVSRTVRAYGYGLRPPADGQPPAPLILTQIETVAGVNNAGAIASVDGVDALFVGPADLSFELKLQPAAPAYDDCLATVSGAAASAGKQCGILLRRLEDLPRLQAQGFTWLAVDSDLAILREGFRRIADKSWRQGN